MVGDPDSNEIYENLIYKNTNIGIAFVNNYGGTTGTLNRINNNYFIENLYHAYDEFTSGGGNLWNTVNTGNYWDNYSGVDNVAPFGIGDTPFQIAGGKQDLYPIFQVISITINLPIQGKVFETTAPDFNITINTLFKIDRKWYKLNNATVSRTYIFTSETSINQILWNDFGDGSINITFYVNDTHGNLAIKKVSIVKDLLDPIVTINTIPGTFFRNTPPPIDVTITESNLNTTWYELTNGTLTRTRKFTFESNIDQALWNLFGNGSITLKFYANDTVGHTTFQSINIWKDILKPVIAIKAPNPGDPFYNAPRFELNITEHQSNIFRMWYTIDNGLFNQTFNSNNGYILQAIWDNAGIGQIKIIFYVEDKAGNVGSNEVIIQKLKSESTDDDSGDDAKKDEGPLTGLPWYIQAAIMGMISATGGVAIRILYSRSKKKKEKSELARQNLLRIESIEDYLKKHLGYNDWEKIKDTYQQFDKREITLKKFMKQGHKIFGEKFIDILIMKLKTSKTLAESGIPPKGISKQLPTAQEPIKIPPVEIQEEIKDMKNQINYFKAKLEKLEIKYKNSLIPFEDYSSKKAELEGRLNALKTKFDQFKS